MSTSKLACIIGSLVLILAFCISPTSSEACVDSDVTVEYDPVEAHCCGGKVHLLSGNESCCTGVAYQDELDICCIDNHGVGHLDTRYWYNTCCNERAFDIADGVCCEGVDRWVLWPKPEYNSCCSGWIAKHTEDIEFCCDIYPYPKDTYSACCGSIYATKHGEVCCGGHTYTVEDGKDTCCDRKPFNKQTQLCCPGASIQNMGEDRNDKCCGSKGYNPDTQICCGDNLVFDMAEDGEDKCCGGTGYSPTTQICCGEDSVFDMTEGGKYKCCGVTGYSTKKQICCGDDDLFDMAEDGRDKCCGGTGYSPNTQICCGDGRIFNNAEDGQGKCCGEVGYSQNTQICCPGNHIYVQAQNGEEHCCGNTHYNSVTQVCCPGDHVYAQVANGKERCCGSKHYNPEYDICCEYRGDSGVWKKSDGYYGCCKTIGTRNLEMCCGGTLVDNLATTCCQNRFWLDLYEYRKVPSGNMWWGLPFDLRTQYCCYYSHDDVRVTSNYDDMGEYWCHLSKTMLT